MLKVIDVRLLYIFTFLFVVPPTMIVNRPASKAIYRFYRDRFKYGRLKSAWMAYKNHCAFSQVVIDRFAMYAGKKFRISIDGFDRFLTRSKSEKGFVQLSSHVGNYEIAGYSLHTEDKRLNALVFGGEKESVMNNRNKLFEVNNIRMVPVKEDMSHLFLIDSALSDGEIVSMPADRVFGSSKTFSIPFLGQEARFPMGPFMLAAMKEVALLNVAVMKVGAKRYRITVSEIDCPLDGSSRQKAAIMARGYVSLLEETVKKHPAQWYNYFDFWSE